MPHLADMSSCQVARVGENPHYWQNWNDAVSRLLKSLAAGLFPTKCAAKGFEGWVFFDRGLIDAAAALEHAIGVSVFETLRKTDRYYRQVFLTPPWPEIFTKDSERQHNMDEALEEYGRLLAAYSNLGYETTILPKTNIHARANFLLDCLR